MNFQIFAVSESKAPLERCRGNNQRNLLVIYEEEKREEVLESFLATVFSALKLELQRDILLLQLTPGEQLSFAALRRQRVIDYLISFGVPPQRLGIQVEYDHYRPFIIESTHFLFAGNLRQIWEAHQQGDKHRSAVLWKSMQLLFPALPQ